MKTAMIGHKVVPSTRGGIETVLTNLCPLLAKDGTEVVCFNRSSDRIEENFIGEVSDGKYKGVVLKKAGTLKIRGISALLASFSAAFKSLSGKFDITHFHAEGPSAAIIIPKLFGRKCVATVHGLDWQRDKWKHGFGAKYIKFGEKMIAKHADGIIVLSESARDYFKETYGRDAVIIPNGIAKPEKTDDRIISEKFGITKDSYICVVARLTEEKGIHYLIEAYDRIKTDKKLVICGYSSDTDGYVAKLKALAAGNANIIFTGFVAGKTLSSVYSNAYAVCLPSDLEGMSISLLEALSYSNAVLCSDIPENVAVCKDTALFFKKGDVNDLKEKLELLINDRGTVERLRKTAAEDVLSRLSWERTASETISYYKEILKGAAR